MIPPNFRLHSQRPHRGIGRNTVAHRNLLFQQSKDSLTIQSCFCVPMFVQVYVSKLDLRTVNPA